MPNYHIFSYHLIHSYVAYRHIEKMKQYFVEYKIFFNRIDINAKNILERLFLAIFNSLVASTLVPDEYTNNAFNARQEKFVKKSN